MNHKPPRITVRECIIQAVVLLAIVVVLFPTVFLGGEVAVPGALLFEWPPWDRHQPETFTRVHNDTTIEALTVFAFWYTLTKEAFQNGEWPLWNSREFTGMPLLANYQSAVFYPTHILHVLGDVYFAMTFYTLLKVWLCGATAYLSARVLGLGPAASRFVSVAWTLCGLNMHWLYWINVAEEMTWAPVLLIGVELLLRRAYRRGFFAVAFSGTLLLLAGHPETVFAPSAGIGVYMILRLVAERRWGRDLVVPLAVALAGWAVALTVCAAQLLPFFEYVVHSKTYGSSLVDASTDFLQPGGLVAFWTPRFFGATVDGNFWGRVNSNHLCLVYPGVVTWVGIALLLTSWKSGSGLRRKAVCFGIACLFFALMAFRPPGIALLHNLPVLRSMWGLWHATFVVFALTFLGGMGLEHWLSRPRKIRETVWPLALAVLATGSVYVLYSFHAGVLKMQGQDGYVLRQIMLSGGLGLAAVGILVLSCRFVSRRLSAVALVALLALDLLLAARGLHPTCPRDQVLVRTELTDLLQKAEQPIRVSAERTPIRSGLLPLYGVETLWGYDGMFPKRVLEFFELAPEPGWHNLERLCSLDYYLFPEGSAPPVEDSPFAFVDAIDGIDVCTNARSLPRAFLVDGVRVLPDTEALLEAMRTLEEDPRKAALTDSPPSTPLPDTQTTDLGQAVVTRHTPLHVAVDVKASADCVLVLTDAYFPGWQVQIDGQGGELFPVYHNFRGTVVPAGDHTVEYRYSPVSFSVGYGVSVAALAINLVVCGRLVVKGSQHTGVCLSRERKRRRFLSRRVSKP